VRGRRGRPGQPDRRGQPGRRARRRAREPLRRAPARHARQWSVRRRRERERMLPIRDLNPARRTPYVTWGLIAACFLVFLYELSIQSNRGDAGLEAFLTRYGAIPARITDAIHHGQPFGSATFGLLSSQFLHAGW